MNRAEPVAVDSARGSGELADGSAFEVTGVVAKPSELSSAAITRKLAQLEAEGARAFDADGCACARGLAARAEALSPRARAWLLRRAEAHVQQLAVRFAAARALAEQRLSAVERVHGSQPELHAALARGELGMLLRRLRRLLGTPARAPRHITASGQVPAAERRLDSAERVYDAASAELAASFAVAQAVDTVPEHAGPYNSLRIATDLLACIGAVSPIYLTTQLSRLEELGRMLTLPEAPAAPAQTPAPRPARRAPKRKAARAAKRKS